MSKDRSVHTDALMTLGTTELDHTAGRDAIHLAVEPMVAGETLNPGQDIGILNGKASTRAKKFVGIVDPFLKAPVFEGEKFWLVVYPRQITSLRHVWSHPDFTEEALAVTNKSRAEEEAEFYLESAAEDLNISFEELLEATQAFIEHGDYLCEGDKFEGANLPNEFWGHYQTYTKTTVPEGKQHDFFSCSC